MHLHKRFGEKSLRDFVLTKYSKSLISFKARQLCRRPGFSRSDWDDVEQKLWETVVRQAPNFDPKRASLDTFLDRVIDFGISAAQLRVIKAALTAEQVQTMGLHEGQLSKESSSRYRRFVAAHGERAWELESLTADQLREIVEAAIRNVLDLETFETEVEREQQEQFELDGKRRQLRGVLMDDLDDID